VSELYVYQNARWNNKKKALYSYMFRWLPPPSLGKAHFIS